MTNEALAVDEAADIYLVDEIGKMECFSARFCAAVRALLDSGKPLVATVALRGSGFIAEVKNRTDVELFEATKENRNEMPARIVERLQRRRGKRIRRDEGAR